MEDGVLHSGRIEMLQHLGFVLSPERPGVLDLFAEGFGEIVKVNPVPHGVDELCGGFIVVIVGRKGSWRC